MKGNIEIRKSKFEGGSNLEVSGRRSAALRLAAFALLLLCGPAAFACAACYGQSDSTLAQGMNWGIYTLLVVVAMVLGGVGSFFVYLGRRAARMPVLPPPSDASN
jgi:hypothetical protein